jgi:hypothetical protein
VLQDNGLPEIAPLAKGEQTMLEAKLLTAFYAQFQLASRRKVGQDKRGQTSL